MSLESLLIVKLGQTLLLKKKKKFKLVSVVKTLKRGCNPVQLEMFG